MGQILDGRSFAKEREQKLKTEVAKLNAQGIKPIFCVINIGDDPASKVYIKTKKRKAVRLGIEQRIYQFPKDTRQEQVIDLIQELNNDQSVCGLMVQLPTPEQIDDERLLESIDPGKDVDGLTPSNMGRLWLNNHFVEPATPSGIMALLKKYQIDPAGKMAVIVGRSNIVGKPLAALLLRQDATVVMAHSKTKDLAAITKQADILISAAGQPKLITKDMIKPEAVVIDVGMNRENGHLVGDADYTNLKDNCAYITPVPGGVGPLTVQFLMEQVVKLAKRQYGQQ